jgi:23S rRNA pseudouridine1911/1915/1917 synthase
VRPVDDGGHSDRTIYSYRSFSTMSALQLYRRSALRLPTALRLPRDHITLCSRYVSSYGDASKQQKALPTPTILHSSNHLLAINKPAGWQSVPNHDDEPNNPKCLLTYLKDAQKGGGSDSRFLMPLHRLDQPVSGLILFGKTSKAASRVQTAWKKVKKDYICVLEDPEKLNVLQEHSTPLNDGFMRLSGYMQQRRRPPRDNHKFMGWSVQMVPCPDDGTSPPPDSKHCSLQWKLLSKPNHPVPILQVQTDQGARHMIRALLASVGGAKIAGDVRYGASRSLSDHSVALHARRLQLPSELKLGEELQRDFSAPIPQTWDAYFEVSEKDIHKWLK